MMGIVRPLSRKDTSQDFNDYCAERREKWDDHILFPMEQHHDGVQFAPDKTKLHPSVNPSAKTIINKPLLFGTNFASISMRHSQSLCEAQSPDLR
jgi:hypothetical protein